MRLIGLLFIIASGIATKVATGNEAAGFAVLFGLLGLTWYLAAILREKS